jgi:biopolymer transport protein TolR
MVMTARPSAASSAEPNMTPMIDVLLVLLIIFMMLAIQVHRTMDAQLPQLCSGVCGATDQIELEIFPGPTYRINRHVVAPGKLPGQLTEVFSGRPDKTIQIAGYPGVRYDEVVAAMDIAKSAGVQIIGIAPKASYLPR